MLLKVQAELIFSAGTFSAIKTAQLHELGSRSDITWATFDLYAWSS